ncbi:MAG: 50S ribosomal protein L13 [Candidatus Paceibacterota bacterium]|jgi:large subunit ribosomal protein L13|nr:50S ribosomal protein L13 [Candidatus Paceibacterota bacterium]MDD3548428.1 50S ribosomal protein L13 [Candidatus Paceibacterota bacterium]MDD4999313.1 50S ribosomal protein L13 [Candidatus Paceibacterota bacterium]MDD5545367.1 50S ribosomal protein L13 [Candidatus Paceibacterota bacterium]
MEKKGNKKREEIVLDAKNQSLGRLASKIAVLLQDKHKSRYAPNKEGETFIIIKNLKDIKTNENKLKSKIYYKHTGYLGHLKETKLLDLWQKDPIKVLTLAVKGMLPKNKLRERRLKRLIIDL